jgi:hypothetical protein
MIFAGNPTRVLMLFGGLLLLAGGRLSADAQITPVVGRNFTTTSYGLYTTNSGALPPDSDGAVGPNDFAELINGMFTVYSKTDGSLRELKTDVDFFGAAGIGVSVYSALTDPRIIYDPASRRWFASMIDVDPFTQVLDGVFGTNDFLIAVSDTSDPAGTWHGILFPSDPDMNYFADFPTLGVDSEGVYISADMYDANGDPTNPTFPDSGPSLVSFPKTNLLANPVIPNWTWHGVMAIGTRGQVLQPASCFDGSVTGCVLSAENIGTQPVAYSNLVTFTVQNVTQPGAATLSDSIFIPVQPYQVPYNATLGVPLFTATQPDGSSSLQANDARLSARVSAVAGVLYAAHSTEINGRIAIRWYRIHAADGVLLESGTIADPAMDLFFPSIAANTNGVVVIAFNGSGPAPNAYVSSYAVAGRTVSGVTTFGSRLLLRAGVTSYHGDDEADSGLSRWGDYSALTVDPADSTRFWTIQEIPLDPANSNVWFTQVTEILTDIPVLSLAVANSNAIVSWPVPVGPFNLETTTNLAGGGWTVVSSGFSTNNGVITCQIASPDSTRFFRLHQP